MFKRFYEFNSDDDAVSNDDGVSGLSTKKITDNVWLCTFHKQYSNEMVDYDTIVTDKSKIIGFIEGGILNNKILKKCTLFLNSDDYNVCKKLSEYFKDAFDKKSTIKYKIIDIDGTIVIKIGSSK